MLSCTGAYVSGAAGSNECPAGSVRIEAEVTCRTAFTAAGKTAGSPFVVTVSTEPRGCNYFTRSNIAYFNADAVGAGNPNVQLLCAAAASGAPPSAARGTVGIGERTVRAAAAHRAAAAARCTGWARAGCV